MAMAKSGIVIGWLVFVASYAPLGFPVLKGVKSIKKIAAAISFLGE
jgi:hypothetical protein